MLTLAKYIHYILSALGSVVLVCDLHCWHYAQCASEEAEPHNTTPLDP